MHIYPKVFVLKIMHYSAIAKTDELPSADSCDGNTLQLPYQPID